MFLKRLGVFIFLFGSTTFAQAVKSPAGMPRCARPRDFSEGGPVAQYEACMKKQRSYCDDNESDSGCRRLKAAAKRRSLFKTMEPDPAQRCAVLRDGSYKCEQDPLKFLGGNEEEVPAATSTPAPSGVPSMGSSPAAAPPATGPVENSPSGEQPAGAPPPVPYPPPPQR